MRRAVLLAVALLAGCRRGGSREEPLHGEACFDDARARFPHVLKSELERCEVAADCAVRYVRLDRCGSTLAVGVRASAASSLDACEAPIDSELAACPAETARAQMGSAAVVDGGFHVACVARRCRTWFGGGGASPGSRAGLGPAWTRAGQETLGHYAWIDREAGVAAIPIDRAMDLLVDDAVSARPARTLRRNPETSSPRIPDR